MAAFLDDALQLSKKTYQHRLLDAGLPEDDAFRERMVRAAEANAARAWLLRIDGRAVAYLLCPAEGDVLLYEYVGYDPDFANLSVGMVLQWAALQELMEERTFHFFDFTPGDGQHKAQFASQRHECADVFVLTPTPRPVLAALLHYGSMVIDDAADGAAKRLGVKQRLKSWMRKKGME